MMKEYLETMNFTNYHNLELSQLLKLVIIIIIITMPKLMYQILAFIEKVMIYSIIIEIIIN